MHEILGEYQHPINTAVIGIVFMNIVGQAQTEIAFLKTIFFAVHRTADLALFYEYQLGIFVKMTVKARFCKDLGIVAVISL
jgi:hypothetical protein